MEGKSCLVAIPDCHQPLHPYLPFTPQDVIMHYV